MAQVGRIGVVALASLVVVDVVLVSFAIQHVRSGNGAPQTLPTIEPTVSTPAAGPTKATTTPRPSSSPSSTASSKPTEPLAAEQMLIDIGSGEAVARARAGACGSGGGIVELSKDGGKTFTKADLPDKASVILRIASSDTDNAWVVGSDPACTEVATFRTSNGGESWEDSNGSAGSWHKAASAAAEVHAPSGTVDVPCAEGKTVDSLSTLSQDLAYALCSDGEVVRSRDSGDSWRKRGDAPGATDLDFVDESTGLAVATGDTSCAGVAVLRTSDAGETWARRACVQTTATSIPDISAAGERAYLAVGDTVWYSDDTGDSWTRRPK